MRIIIVYVRLPFVVVRVRTLILLRFACNTRRGMICFINISALTSVGNCGPRYSLKCWWSDVCLQRVGVWQTRAQVL